MSKCSEFLKVFVFVNAILLCLSAIPANSQDLGRRLSFSKVSKKKKTRTNTRNNTGKRKRRKRRPRRTSSTVKVKPIIKFRSVKTSNLTVSSEPGAEVILLSLRPRAKSITKKVPFDDSGETIEFENLRPGKYKVTVRLDGFQELVTEVDVPRQKTVGIDMDLEPLKYDFHIETNITEGEIRYAPAKYEGENPDGSLRTKETGGYCIVTIKNGEAVIRDLERGYYNIDVRPTKQIEYQPVLTAINVPNDIPEDTKVETESGEANAEVESYSIDLEKKISTETFSSSWSSNEWHLAGGWSLLGGTMRNLGQKGVALPRNEQYRYYTDFEMISDVISSDGKSVGFALRAVDKNNYYLIQISGANSPEPFLASGFIVREGVINPFFSVPINHFSETIESMKSFRVIIKGQENTFRIFIEDSETAKKLEVGDMIDRDETFKKGAIGIADQSNSEFTVGSFIVCANSCSANY